MNIGEKWKPIPNFEGFYEASSLGRIRSVDRWCNHSRYKNGLQHRQGRLISPGRSSKYGHLKVKLCSNGKCVSRHVHQLILETFVGPKPAGNEVRHLNGIADDNRLENLAYGTRQENADDAKKHGTMRSKGASISKSKKGISTVWCEKHGMAKLTDDQVREMRQRFADGMTTAEASKMYGINQNHARQIQIGKAWAKLDEEPRSHCDARLD